MYCVIIEKNPFIAEDISATWQDCFPTLDARIFMSFDQAREALGVSDGLIAVIISIGSDLLEQISALDMKCLTSNPVLWLDAPPVGFSDHEKWVQISKPFTHEGLREAIRALPLQLELD